MTREIDLPLRNNMVSANFRLGHSAVSATGPWTWGSYGEPIDVVAGEWVKMELESTAGVATINVTIPRADEAILAAGAPTVTIDQVSRTATFQVGGSAAAYCVEVTVNPASTSPLTTALAVHILTQGGHRLLALDETTEASAAYKWLPKINALVRSAVEGTSGWVGLAGWTYDTTTSIATSVSQRGLVVVGTPVRFCLQTGGVIVSTLSDGDSVYGIVGVSDAITEPSGQLFVNFVDDGGGDFHADIYTRYDSVDGFAGLIGHTAAYTMAGAQTIIADNGSGISGTISTRGASDGVEMVEFYRWGVVNHVSDAIIEWDGAVIDSTVEEVWIGDRARVVQLTAFVAAETGDDSGALETGGQKLHYSGPPARAVRQQFCANAVSGDGVTALWEVVDRSGWSEPEGNLIGATSIADTSRASSTNGVVLMSCRVVPDDQIDVVMAAVSGGTATQTSVNLIMVLE